MITWLSTKSPIRMLDAPIDSATEAHLRANVGVDPAILASDLGLWTSRVEACQRRLGLRKCVPARKKRSRAAGITVAAFIINFLHHGA
jgi:hypothetical protein